MAAIYKPIVTAEEDVALLGYLNRFLLESDENSNFLWHHVLIEDKLVKTKTMQHKINC